MKEAARSDRRLRAALDLLLNAPISGELAACKTFEDLEAFAADAGRRADRIYMEYLTSPETQAKRRQELLEEYKTRMWKLHKDRPTNNQIHSGLGIDGSDFRKFLKCQKFGINSTIVDRIVEFLFGDDLPPKT
jgi:hypothetical protein